MRKYFNELFESLCLCFNIEVFDTNIQYKAKNSNKASILKSSFSIKKEKDNSFNAYMSSLAARNAIVINNFDGSLCKSCNNAKQTTPVKDEKSPKGINIYR